MVLEPLFSPGDEIKLKSGIIQAGGEEDDRFVYGETYKILKIETSWGEFTYTIKGVSPSDSWVGKWVDSMFELAQIKSWKQRLCVDDK